MIIVDTSVLVPALADDTANGDLARQRLAAEKLVAPEIIDLEVTSAIRHLHRSGAVDRPRAEVALADLRDLPITRVSHRWLTVRCWELRDNLTPYDAAYVAVAELLATALVTADERMARAPGPRCSIELLAVST